MPGTSEATALPGGSVDLIAGRFILHHLEVHAAVVELDRPLAPEGRGVFIETSALNPVLVLLFATR